MESSNKQAADREIWHCCLAFPDRHQVAPELQQHNHAVCLSSSSSPFFVLPLTEFSSCFSDSFFLILLSTSFSFSSSAFFLSLYSFSVTSLADYFLLLVPSPPSLCFVLPFLARSPDSVHMRRF